MSNLLKICLLHQIERQGSCLVLIRLVSHYLSQSHAQYVMDGWMNEGIDETQHSS